MQYREREDGPLTTIRVEPGAIVIELEFERPFDYTRLHSHTFDHWMMCVSGAAQIFIGTEQITLRPGDRYLVEARQRHGVLALVSRTMLSCRHENPDIHPGDPDGIPIEWLRRLTDEVPA